jgi:hypothetical protein
MLQETYKLTLSTPCEQVKDYSSWILTIVRGLSPIDVSIILKVEQWHSAILDTKPLTSGSLPPAECARPGLHEFLTAVYPHYDICIWHGFPYNLFPCVDYAPRSQTSWIWLETKLVELGMLGPSMDRNYEVCTCSRLFYCYLTR